VYCVLSIEYCIIVLCIIVYCLLFILCRESTGYCQEKVESLYRVNRVFQRKKKTGIADTFWQYFNLKKLYLLNFYLHCEKEDIFQSFCPYSS